MKNSFIVLALIVSLAILANSQTPYDPNADYNVTFIDWWPWNSSKLRICQIPSSDGTYCAKCKPFAHRNDDYDGGLLKSYGICIFDWIPDNCYAFDWNMNCVLCHDGYWMNVSLTNDMNLCKPKTYGCLTYDSVAKKCKTCMPGWTMNTTVNGASNQSEYFCYFVPDFNCIKYDVNNLCQTCVANYSLSNNRCVLWWPNCATMNGNVCSKCNINYQLDSTGKCVAYVKITNCASQIEATCSSCLNGFNLINNQCVRVIVIQNCLLINGSVCVKCSSGYMITTDGKCAIIPQIPNCLNQMDFTCLNCTTGFSLINNYCTYIIENCDQVNGMICTRCKTNFFITNDSRCAPIPKITNCFNQLDYTCLNCTSGFALINNTCVFMIQNCNQVNGNVCVKCNTNFQISSDGKCTPIPKIPNCASQTDYLCQSCVVGWELSSNQCVYIIENCAQVNQMACTKCNVNFQLTIDKKCAPIPRIPNCYLQQDYTCQSCLTGWTLSNNQCTFIIDNCNIVNGMICSKCNTDYSITTDGKCSYIERVPNCVSQVDFLCSSCLVGYALTNNSCVYIIENCKQVNGMVCAQCNTNYAVTTDGKCQLIPKVINCASQVEFNCQACVQGFILFNNQCILATPYCIEYSGATCTKCSANYLLNNLNTCQIIRKISNCFLQAGPLCMQCNSGFNLLNNTCVLKIQNCIKVTGAVCEQCKEGFMVSPDGKCAVDPFFGIDMNCRLYDMTTFNKCLACSGGFFLNTIGKCEQVDPLCKTFNGKNGFCLSCYVGFVLNNTKGKCVKMATLSLVSSNNTIDYCNQYDWVNNVCIKCAQGCYFDSNGKCQKYSDENCKIPSVDLKSCAECYQGYVFDETLGKCNMANFNCATWSNGKCSTCAKGYYLDSSFKCVLTDPFCYIFNQITKTCVICYPGYVWDSERRCKFLQDISPDLAKYSMNCAKFIDGQCSQCYFGYYIAKDSSGAYCAKVNDLCKSYDKVTGKCTSCYLGYYLSLQGQCLRYI